MIPERKIDQYVSNVLFLKKINVMFSSLINIKVLQTVFHKYSRELASHSVEFRVLSFMIHPAGTRKVSLFSLSPPR